MAFVEATNTAEAHQGGGDGYQSMLTHLFGVFEGDHGTNAAVLTILEALKPAILRFHKPEKLEAKFNELIEAAYAADDAK